MSYDSYEVRPAIIVVDVSGSMAKVLDSVGVRVNGLIRDFRADPVMAETVALAILEFDVDVRGRLSLDRLSSQGTDYTFETERQRTDFGGALDWCRRTLTTDLPRIARRSYRPAVFFISDGGHNVGDFAPARNRLLSVALPPKIVVFEVVTDAHSPQVLEGLATDPRLYLRVGATADEISEVLRKVYRTVGGVGGDGLTDAFLEGEVDDAGNQQTYETDQEPEEEDGGGSRPSG